MSCDWRTVISGSTSMCRSTWLLRPVLRAKHFSTPSTPGTCAAAARISAIIRSLGMVSINCSMVSRVTRTNDQFYALFTQIRGAAATTLARQVAATAQMDAAESTVLLPLGTLAGLQEQRADTAAASASSAETQAFWVVVAATILALTAGVA